MCSNKVPFLDPTKPYPYANFMEMRFIILCGFFIKQAETQPYILFSPYPKLSHVL